MRRVELTFGLVLLAGTIALAGLSEAEPRHPAPERPLPPNFVVVMADDQAEGSLRYMPKVRSALVRRGMRFEESFVTTPLCCPSRATFLTGQYSHNHGVLAIDSPDGGYQGFYERQKILPVWLQRAGYRTGHVGKYLNGYGVAERGSAPTEIPAGWDRWSAIVNHTEYQMYGFTLNRDGVLRDYGHEAADYQTDVIAAETDRFVRGLAGDEPFFLSVAPVAPHSEGVLEDRQDVGRDPRPAPRHQGDLSHLPVPTPPSFARPTDGPPATIGRKLMRHGLISAEALRHEFLGRTESLLAIDDLVGALIKRLRDMGELRDTYFIYTSDNGYLLGEHGLTGKSLPYDEAVKVPLVIRGPGIPQRSRSNELVANVDLAPTIAALAGAEPTRVSDGHSLERVLDGGTLPRRAVLTEYLAGREAYSSVRTRKWMFATYETGGRELYDMRTDPQQMQNLADEERHLQVRRRLAHRLRALAGCSGRSCR